MVSLIAGMRVNSTFVLDKLTRGIDKTENISPLGIEYDYNALQWVGARRLGLARL